MSFFCGLGRQILALILGLVFLSIVTDASIEASRNLNASDVQAMIYGGKQTDFNNSIILGNIDIVALRIDNPLHFNQTHFKGRVNFNNVTFNGMVYFIGSQFDSIADFKSSRFNNSANFSDSNFEGISFNYTVFNGVADFKGSTFNGNTYFDASNFFKSFITFENSTFNRKANFYNSIFSKFMTVFRGSTFNGDAEFDSTEFNGITQFSHFGAYDSGPAKITIFNSKAIFSHSAFKGNIDFSGADFKGDANFVNSVFDSSKEKVIRFSFSQFDKNAYFDNSMFNGSSEFNWCQFSGDASFENTKFNGVLNLTRTRYDNFYIYWRDITNLSYDDATYLSLINNFKKLGYFDDANNCYYDYMNLRRDRAPNFSKATEYFLLDSICGYGVRWTYTIRSALYTWIFFALLYYFSGGHLLKGSLVFSAVAVFSLPKEIYGNDDEYDTLMKSLLPDVGYVGIFNKISLRTIFALERIIGWGLLILMINTISRAMIYY